MKRTFNSLAINTIAALDGGMRSIVLCLLIALTLLVSACGGGGKGWPPVNVRNNYGIGSLSEPPGSSNFSWIERPGAGPLGKGIVVTFTPSGNAVSVFDAYFKANGWSTFAVFGGSGTWLNKAKMLSASFESGERAQATFGVSHWKDWPF